MSWDWSWFCRVRCMSDIRGLDFYLSYLHPLSCSNIFYFLTSRLNVQLHGFWQICECHKRIEKKAATGWWVCSIKTEVASIFPQFFNFCSAAQTLFRLISSDSIILFLLFCSSFPEPVPNTHTLSGSCSEVHDLKRQIPKEDYEVKRKIAGIFRAAQGCRKCWSICRVSDSFQSPCTVLCPKLICQSIQLCTKI